MEIKADQHRRHASMTGQENDTHSWRPYIIVVSMTHGTVLRFTGRL